MISAGLLREFIEILYPVVSENEYGEEVVSWETLVETRAQILKEGGSRALVEAAVQNPHTRTILIRYREGITFRQRVKFLSTGDIYVIENVEASKFDGSIRLNLSYIFEKEE